MGRTSREVARIPACARGLAFAVQDEQSLFLAAPEGLVAIAKSDGAKLGLTGPVGATFDPRSMPRAFTNGGWLYWVNDNVTSDPQTSSKALSTIRRIPTKGGVAEDFSTQAPPGLISAMTGDACGIYWTIGDRVMRKSAQ